METVLFKNFCETMERYELLRGINRVIFLFSGGKDATVGLYLLKKYIFQMKINMQLEAILVDYPTHVYYENGKECNDFNEIIKFWSKNNVKLYVLKSSDKGFSDEEENACKVCKNSRKKEVDKYISENVGNEVCATAIATGYTLYDVQAYVDEICLTTDFF